MTDARAAGGIGGSLPSIESRLQLSEELLLQGRFDDAIDACMFLLPGSGDDAIMLPLGGASDGWLHVQQPLTEQALLRACCVLVQAHSLTGR